MLRSLTQLSRLKGPNESDASPVKVSLKAINRVNWRVEFTLTGRMDGKKNVAQKVEERLIGTSEREFFTFIFRHSDVSSRYRSNMA